MTCISMDDEWERRPIKKVTFSCGNSDDEDYGYCSMRRRKRGNSATGSSPLMPTRPGRSQSFSNIIGRTDSPTADYKSLFEITRLSSKGGLLRSCYSMKTIRHFDVSYTTFNELTLTNVDLLELFRIGDVVYVSDSRLYARREWRAMHIRSLQYTFSRRHDGCAVWPNTNRKTGLQTWVTFGRVKVMSLRHRHMIIATGIKESMIYANAKFVAGDIKNYKENVTVLVRAEKRVGESSQPQAAPWYAVNVQMVGEIVLGRGYLKQIRLGIHNPYVVVAPSFGWIVIPREVQHECRNWRRDGDWVDFSACANTPCSRYTNKRWHSWKILEFIDSEKSNGRNKQLNDHKRSRMFNAAASTTSAASLILPTNQSIVTNCTCQGNLVCICLA